MSFNMLPIVRLSLLPLLTWIFGVTSADPDIAHLQAQVERLSRQLMRQNFYTEEYLRASGRSGVVAVRHQRDGTRPYHSEATAGSGVMSIHDHADSIRTVGMGEAEMVLNGVSFRTRHNDYLLISPHRTSRAFKAVEDVPFPEVPPSVLEKPSVEAQICEMQEYFRAFKLQDSSIRDYEPYFPAVLSYMEGAWTLAEEIIDEPFPGERHWMSARTWKEMEEAVMFDAYSGQKEGLENRGRLPRVIVDFNGSHPVYAQFNYRILTHKLKQKVRPDRLSPIDDLGARIVHGLSLEKYANTREARFQIHPTDSATFRDGRYGPTFLDSLMGEIPGMDNYPADLKDEYMGLYSLDPNSLKDKPMNTGYYHHTFKVRTKDAMGKEVRHVGYSDESLYRAQTTHENIVGLDFDSCSGGEPYNSGCERKHQKWSWAIPLEILYLTPLAKWNPYDLAYNGWAHADPRSKWVRRGGRDGSESRPYNGTDSMRFCHTPMTFFSKAEYEPRPADSTGEAHWVMDKRGEAQQVCCSGMRTFIPNIPGVGEIRTRYPIMPLHGEGSAVWKELAALKDIVLDPERFAHLVRHKKKGATSSCMFIVGASLSKFDSHTHVVEINPDDIATLRKGGKIRKHTNKAVGHTHGLDIAAEALADDAGFALVILRCGGKKSCWDGHPRQLIGGFDSEWKFVEDIEELIYN